MNKQKLIDVFEKHTPSTQMTKDETKLLLSFLMSDDQNLSVDIEEIDKESEIYKHFKLLIEAFQAQVFLKRIKGLTTLKISLGALVMLMFHMESAGKAVMHCFYLYYNLPEDTLVNLKTISELFPWGFFSEQQLNEIWDAQKVNSDDFKDNVCIGAPDNMIDYLESWK